MAGVSGGFGALLWVLALVNWSATPRGEHVSGGVLLLGAMALTLTLVMAAFAAAAYVLSALSEVEPIR